MRKKPLEFELVEDILERLRYYHSATCGIGQMAGVKDRLEEDAQKHPLEYARATKLWRMLYASQKERRTIG